MKCFWKCAPEHFNIENLRTNGLRPKMNIRSETVLFVGVIADIWQHDGNTL